MCLTETLDEMVGNGTLHPDYAIQVLVQFDKVNNFAFYHVDGCFYFVFQSYFFCGAVDDRSS